MDKIKRDPRKSCNNAEETGAYGCNVVNVFHGVDSLLGEVFVDFSLVDTFHRASSPQLAQVLIHLQVVRLVVEEQDLLFVR